MSPTPIPTEDLEQRVLRAIGRVTRGEVRIDSTFEELAIDSLIATEVLFEVEEEFDITIPNDDAKSIRSVRDVLDGVQLLLAGATNSDGDDGALGGAAAS